MEWFFRKKIITQVRSKKVLGQNPLDKRPSAKSHRGLT